MKKSRQLERRTLIEILLVVCCIIFTIILPRDKADLTPFTRIILALDYIVGLIAMVMIVTDVFVSDVYKNICAFGFIGLCCYLFYKYSNARWDMIGKIFFNFKIMEKNDPAYGSTGVTNWQLMKTGLLTTIKLFIYSSVVATFWGLLLAVIRTLINDKVLNRVIIIMVNLCRSMPMLVMLIMVYSALPYTGVVLSAEVSGVLTLGLIEGTLLSETFRAGINSVHAVQTESARALGMTGWQTIQRVILPQAIMVILPPYINTLVGIMKGTALFSHITIFEMMKTASQIQAWYANPTPILLAGVFYIIILLPMTRLSLSLEKRMKNKNKI